MERDDCMINTNQIIQGAESREKSKGAHYLEVSNDRMDELDYARPLDLTVPIPMEHDRDVEERGIDDLDRGGGELEHGRADLEQGRGDLAHGRDDLEHGRAELDGGGGDLEQGRGDLEQGRGDLVQGRGDLEHGRGDLEHGRGDLEQGRGDLEQGRGDLEHDRGDREHGVDELEHRGDDVQHGGDEEFSPGQVFKNEDEAKTFLRKYNEKNFTEFRIRSNHKRAMVVKCKHGVHRVTTSKDLRPHTHFNYIGCKAQINFYKSQKPGATSLKVTKVNLEHNDHEINEDVYNHKNVKITEEDEELIKLLANAKTKPSRIQKVLLSKNKKRVTIKKLKNVVAKISTPENKEESAVKFEDFLDEVENGGGVIEWETDADGSIKTLFITSSRMKTAFRNNNPPVVQLDTSFNFDKALYKVAAFVYLDPNTNLSEIAAFSLMSQESSSSFEFILGIFSKMCIRQDLIFLIDKDFTEVASLKKIFPSSIVLLCIFHALKYFRTLITTALARQEVKVEIFSQFKKVLYSRTEAIFEEENKIFLSLVQGVEVRTRDSYVLLSTYYCKNWKASAHMWVKFYRNSLPLLGDNTSNRVESSFATLKKSIEDTFVSLPQTIHAIQHLVEFADNRVKERYCGVTNRVLRIYHRSEQIRNLNEEASTELNERGCKLFHKVLSRFEEKKADLELVDGGVKETFSADEQKSYKTSPTTCTCTFFANHQAPCYHIIFIRRLDSIHDPNNHIFEKGIFHARYHRNKGLVGAFVDPGEDNLEEPADIADDDTIDDYMDDEEPQISAMNDNKKFKKIMPILLRISNLTCAHGTKQFLRYVEEFETVETMIRRGRSIFKAGGSSRVDLGDPEVNNNDASEDVANKVTATDDTQFQNTESRADENHEDTIPDGEPSNGEETHDPEPKSRFLNLASKFKESIKPKGRPKKKKTQVSFNKTALDRKVKKDKPKQSQGMKKSKVKKNFIDDDSDLPRTSRLRKPVMRNVTDLPLGDEEILDDEMDISSEDSGSFKPSEESGGSQSSLDEVTFHDSKLKPKCDKCFKMILKFSDMTECDLCFEPLHEKCYKNGGCRRCRVEDEFY